MPAVCSSKIEKLLPLLQFRVQFYIDLVTQQPIELRLELMTTIGSDLLDTKNSSQGGYRMSPNKMVATGRMERWPGQLALRASVGAARLG